MSDSALDRRTASGALRRIHPGVFAVGPAVPIPLAEETAALLACGEGAVLSHHNAAALWEIRPLSQPNRSIHVTVEGRQAGRPAGVCVHRSAHLPPIDVRTRHGLPVTSAARTILDIAQELTSRELGRAIEEALMRRLIHEPDLRRAAREANGRRGAPIVASHLDHRRGSTFTRSSAEELCLTLIRAAQLPEPEVNVSVHGFEVDFFWRRQTLVLEVDGYAYHSTRGAFERDRRKGAALSAAGVAVMRVTWHQLSDEAYAVIARLAQALTSHPLTPRLPVRVE